MRERALLRVREAKRRLDERTEVGGKDLLRLGNHLVRHATEGNARSSRSVHDLERRIAAKVADKAIAGLLEVLNANEICLALLVELLKRPRQRLVECIFHGRLASLTNR